MNNSVTRRFFSQYSNKLAAFGILRIVLAALIAIASIIYISNAITTARFATGVSYMDRYYSRMTVPYNELFFAAGLLVFIPFAAAVGMGVTWAVMSLRASKNESKLISLKAPAAMSLSFSMLCALALTACGIAASAVCSYYGMILNYSRGYYYSMSPLYTIFLVLTIFIFISLALTVLTSIARMMFYRTLSRNAAGESASASGAAFYRAMKIISSIFKIIVAVMVIVLMSGALSFLPGSSSTAYYGMTSGVLILLCVFAFFISVTGAVAGFYEAYIVGRYKLTVSSSFMPAYDTYQPSPYGDRDGYPESDYAQGGYRQSSDAYTGGYEQSGSDYYIPESQPVSDYYDTADQSTAAGAFCPACGSPIEPGSAFCPICGTNL